MNASENYIQFFTATVLEWRHLLKDDVIKEIITGSLRFLVEKKRVTIYSFVIMPNHLHIIWQMQSGHKRSDVQRDFLKFTSQQIKFYLQKKTSKF